MEALHQPGEIIAQRYRITDTLGQGGVGITYAAEDLKSGEQVALKVLSLRQMGDWKVLELFEREAKILAHLNHPAIPRYLDYFQVDTPEDRAFYIVQQLAEGKSLAELGKIGWRTNESGVRRIASQILEILVYLHDLKPPVVHRDIKPQNLVWGQNAKIFLVDFGAVQDTYRSTFAKGSTIVGTYGYMAPEQFLGQAIPATDLYGLGATVLFLLTHRSPSELPQERLKINFRSRLQLSEGFADWLEKMLDPDAENRFHSAREALEVLRGSRVIAKSKSRPSLLWKAIVGVGFAAIAAVCVLNYFKNPLLNSLGLVPSVDEDAVVSISAEEAVQEAAYSTDIDAIRNYLEQGGNVNVKDNQGNTLLHLTLYTPQQRIRDRLEGEDQRQLVELLIAKGIQVNAKNNQGLTPLDMVVIKGTPVIHRAEIAKLLIAKGAKMSAQHIKGKQGRTLLHLTAERLWYGAVKELLAQGVQVNAKDNQGNTPLHLAIHPTSAELIGWENGGHMIERKDLVELLIAQGADVNAKNNQGITPLALAMNAKYDHSDIVQLLKSHGATE